MGWSPLGIAALVLWTLIVLGIGLLIGRRMRSDAAERTNTDLRIELARLSRAAEKPAPAVSTAPPGRRGAETSQLPALGERGYRVRPPVPPDRPGPDTDGFGPDYPATAPAGRVSRADVPAEEADPDLPREKFQPRRRVDDAPDEPLRPPLAGGRRRSDQRMTRAESRRIREGGDP